MTTVRKMPYIPALGGESSFVVEHYTNRGDGLSSREYRRFQHGNHQGQGWGCGLNHIPRMGAYGANGWNGNWCPNDGMELRPKGGGTGDGDGGGFG